MTDSHPMGRCGAKSRQATPCGLAAGWGTDHVGVGRCRLHGGASRQAQVAGVVALARREAEAMGRPIRMHPQEAIVQCIGIAAGEVRYGSERIAELEPDAILSEVVHRHERPLQMAGGREGEGMVEETRIGPAQLHSWIRVRQRAMDRLVSYSATAIKAGVEEQLLLFAEREGAAIVKVLEGALSDLGYAADPRVASAVGRHLRAVADARDDGGTRELRGGPLE